MPDVSQRVNTAEISSNHKGTRNAFSFSRSLSLPLTLRLWLSLSFAAFLNDLKGTLRLPGYVFYTIS